MTSPNWHLIIRAVKVLAAVAGLTLLGALITDDLHQRQQIGSLTSTLLRARPTTDYGIAVNQTEQCRDSIRDRFLAHIAAAFDRSDPARSAAASKLIALDQSQLDGIDLLCPYPAPPLFDPDSGLLTSPPGTGPPLPPVPTLPPEEGTP